jgi:putative membrane protein
MNAPINKSLARLSTLVAVATLCFGSVATAFAADSANRGQLSAKDYKFASEALEGGTMEVTLGQLAMQKGSDQAIRAFGQRMVTDHQKANQELAQLLTQKGATLPEAMTKKSDKMTEKFQGETGSDFDKSYIKHMVKDHKKDVEEFQKAAEKADDGDLKNWAAKTLPTLQEHLSVAQTTEKDITSQKH